jgi:hypothetical protein
MPDGRISQVRFEALEVPTRALFRMQSKDHPNHGMASSLSSPVCWGVLRVPRTAFCFIQSATTGFTAKGFLSHYRVSLKEAFKGPEPDDDSFVVKPCIERPFAKINKVHVIFSPRRSRNDGYRLLVVDCKVVLRFRTIHVAVVPFSTSGGQPTVNHKWAVAGITRGGPRPTTLNLGIARPR